MFPSWIHAQDIKDNGNSTNLEEVTLQLIWKNQFQFAGYYAAKEKGFYQDVGLDVAIKEYEFGMDVTQDVLSGKVDFGVGRSSLILEKLNGSDIFLLAAIYQHSPFILLAKKRSDLGNVADLKNKKIMTTDDVVGMASLTAMLIANGVSEQLYTKQVHSFNVDDLISGKTDAIAAYISNEPFQMENEGVPYKAFSPKDHGFDFYSDILFTSQNLHKNDPDQVNRFYQASIKGWGYAFANIDEVVGLIQDKYNTQGRSKEALLFEANALKKMAYTQEVPLGDINQNRINQIAQVYRLLSITKSTENLSDFYYKPKHSSKNTQVNLTAEEKQWLKKHPIIKVHNELSWAPFNFNKNGMPSGFSIDYMDLLAKRIGIEVEYVSGEWGPLLQQVFDKKLDVMLNIVKTPERLKHLLYTNSYIKNPNVIIAKKDGSVTDIHSLEGKRVTYPEGFFYDEILTTKFPNIIRIPKKNILESLKAVYFGHADATLGELTVARYLMKENLLTGLAIKGEFDVGNPELEKLNIAVRNDWPELQSILIKAMRSISIKETNELQIKWIAFDVEEEKNEIKSAIKTSVQEESGVPWIIIGAILVIVFLFLAALVLPRLFSDEDLAHHFGSKRFRAAALIVTSLMVVLVAVLVGRTLDHNRKLALAATRADLMAVHQSVMERIYFWVNDHQNFLTQLGRDPKLVAITKRLLVVPAQAEALKASHPLVEAREFFKKHEREFGKISFFIINPEYISIGSGRDANLGTKNFIGAQKPDLIAKVFTGEAVFIPPLRSDIAFDDSSGASANENKKPLTMFFAVPIRDVDGTVLAVLTQRLRTDGRLSRIMQAGRIGQTGESYLINEEGLLLTKIRFRNQLVDIGLVKEAATEEDQIQVRDPGGNMLEGFRPQGSNAELPFTRMAEDIIKISQDDALRDAKGERGGMVIQVENSYRDYRGVPVYGAWMWADNLGLGMATEIDVDESLSGYYSLRFSLIVIASVTLALTISALLVTLMLGERATRTMRRARDELEGRVVKRTQDLQDSEKRTRAIIDNAVDGIIVINDKGIVQSFSPAAERIFGYSSDEIIGNNINILTPESTASEHDGYIKHFFVAPKASKIVGRNREVVGLRKDGSRFPMDLAVGEAVLGNEHIFTGTIRDITERKKADQRLADKEKQLRVALDNMSSGILMFDKDGKVILLNDNYINLFDFPKDLMVVGGDAEASIRYQATRGDFGKGDVDTLVDQVMGALTSGEELTYERKLFTGNIVEINLSPTPDGGTVAIYTEITERKLAELELKRSEELLSAIIENVPGGVFVLDKDLNFILTNSHYNAMFKIPDNLTEDGNPLEGVIRYLAPTDAYGTGEVDKLVEQRLAQIREKIPSPIEVTVDSQIYIMTYGRMPDGKRIGIVTEITERKQAEDELRKARDVAEEATNAKSEFLANMSHELRTPMNAILGYSEMLIEEAEDVEQEDFIPDLKKINQAGTHLLSLINDVLDLSKIETGKMEAFAENIDVNNLIDEVSGTVRPLIEKNSNKLVIERGEQLGDAYQDLTKLRQAFYNLFSNAAKFTHEGTITLRVERTDQSGVDFLNLAVSDTGIGIADDKIDKVFEAFAQADGSTTRNYGGTGLGLAISRRFCQLLGGDLTLHSKLGQGSTFTISIPTNLPVTEPDHPIATTASPIAGTEMQTASEIASGSTILVIDDDPEAGELIERNLVKDGFNVVKATSGEQGLLLAHELQPVAITLDVIMPDMDGWSVLRALKADPVLCDIPVIMLTMLEDRTRGYSLGAVDYLTKPVNREELQKALSRYSSDDVGSKVLLVDDEVEGRELMAHNLEKAGWAVSEAGNGQEALDIMNSVQPQLILLDLMMPVMDGFGFLSAMRARPEWQHIPVIVVTAKELTEEDRKHLNGMVEEVFEKSSDTCDDLLQRVREAVSKYDVAQ